MATPPGLKSCSFGCYFGLLVRAGLTFNDYSNRYLELDTETSNIGGDIFDGDRTFHGVTLGNNNYDDEIQHISILQCMAKQFSEPLVAGGEGGRGEKLNFKYAQNLEN